MTTWSSSTRIRHDSDANFRGWMNEFHTALTTVGAVQTGDTGQINMATAARAGTNADAGYAIYYMNDSLHGTKPVYFKLYFGTGGSTSSMRLRIEIGTGSNGTGTLTGGDGNIRTISTSTTTSMNTDTTLSSWACMARGALWISFKNGRFIANYAVAGFGIFRVSDATGEGDTAGIVTLLHNNGTAINTSAPTQRCYFGGGGTSWSTIVSNYPGLGVWPSPDTASVADEDSNVQFMIPFYGCLRPRPLNNVLICWSTDAIPGTTYSLTGVGSTAFTYLYLERSFGYVAAIHTGGNTSLGMLLVYE